MGINTIGMSDKEKKAPKKKVASKKLDTTNPLGKGVTYKAFLANVKGNVTVDSMCKKHGLTPDEIAWIKQELDNLKQ